MGLPTVRQLEYFVTAARLGTFAAAAAAHHVAQPSLSEQITVLEKSLDLALFTRTSRRLLLTDAGKQLLPLAERAVANVTEVADMSRRVKSVDQGTVSFGTFNSAHLYLLTDLIREFRTRFPGVRIRVTGLNSAEVADAVRDGHLEAGLVQLPIDDRELTVTPSVFVDQAVYVTVDPDNARGPIDITTLAQRRLILSEARWSNDDPLRVSLLERAQSAGVTVEPIVEVEFQTHALELAAQGVGDSLVSFHVGRSMIARRGMFWAPLDPPVVEHYAFVTRRSGAISPATREFMRLAQRILARVEQTAPSVDSPA
ncbi:MAG: LysR family transcriptional regulator [Microbacterium sp. SCN 71-21]|uniref:LysR family transcriptional regulator n=1 Tax=Microbacterium sp. SCN 71-21 TaxID=1660116 RepID=UPI00086CC314|nr:LysR family transcriptional regulator [Microbacterium sp. SCN 71-21]ODU77617.1 MAG: LysR family transcriptional regulator [Microbacterium sp. SCN 71-21]